MKVKALRFWVWSIKRKGLQSFIRNIQQSQKRRENAFKVYIFDQRRLLVLGLRAFQNIKQANYQARIRRFKILKHLSKQIKKKVLSAFRHYHALLERRRYLDLIEQRIKKFQSNSLVRKCFESWMAQGDFQKSRSITLFSSIVRYGQLKPAFYKLFDYSQDLLAKYKTRLIKQGFNAFVQNRQMNKRLKQIIMFYRSQLKLRAFSELKRIIHMEKISISVIVRAIEKVKMEQAFRQIASLSDMKQGIERIASIVNQNQLQTSFKRLMVYAKLAKLNDTLLFKLRKASAFLHWKDCAFQDMRIAKLMARAQKHRNRKLKGKVIRGLSHLYAAPSVLPIVKKHLKAKAMDLLKKHTMLKKVERFKNLKAAAVYNRHLVQRAFSILGTDLDQRMEENKFEIKMNEKVKRFRRFSLSYKAIKAFKLSAYRARILAYIQRRRFLEIGNKLLTNMREGAIAQRTKFLKNARAEQFHCRWILSYSMQLLSKNAKNRVMMRFKMEKAARIHCYHLVHRAMRGLYQQAAIGSQKRQQLRIAFNSRIRVKLGSLVAKMVTVGIYWASIKGRFGNPQGRLCLAMKYGYRWRAKTIVHRMQRCPIANRGQGTLSDQQVSCINPAVTKNVIRILSQTVSKSSPSLTNRSAISIASSDSRLFEIERELVSFKNKKLLFKELQEQLSSCSNPGVSHLLGSKIESLWRELQTMVPHVLQMNNEIKALRQTPKQQY